MLAAYVRYKESGALPIAGGQADQTRQFWFCVAYLDAIFMRHERRAEDEAREKAEDVADEKEAKREERLATMARIRADVKNNPEKYRPKG